MKRNRIKNKAKMNKLFCDAYNETINLKQSKPLNNGTKKTKK